MPGPNKQGQKDCKTQHQFHSKRTVRYTCWIVAHIIFTVATQYVNIINSLKNKYKNVPWLRFLTWKSSDAAMRRRVHSEIWALYSYCIYRTALGIVCSVEKNGIRKKCHTFMYIFCTSTYFLKGPFIQLFLLVAVDWIKQCAEYTSFTWTLSLHCKVYVSTVISQHKTKSINNTEDNLNITRFQFWITTKAPQKTWEKSER